MTEQISIKAAVAGHVIEDLTYVPLEPGGYLAGIAGGSADPIYKSGGYFVFLNLPDADYQVTLSGAAYQRMLLDVTVPVAGTLVWQEGDNELIVVVRSVAADTRRITFDAVTLPVTIRAGAPVRANGLATTLVSTLFSGQVTQARLDDLGGLAAGDVVRIVRGTSIRLKHGPYSTIETPVTRVVGRVTAQSSPGTPIEGAQVRLTRVGAENVVTQTIAGAKVAVCNSPAGLTALGTGQDVTATANLKGDFHVYFDRELPSSSLTLEASAAGFTTQSQTIFAPARTRVRADFELATA